MILNKIFYSLHSIKIVHTTIWIIMATSVFYVFYSGLTGNIDALSWIGVALIFLEGIALILGKGDCPLHVYALRLTGKQQLNDTYLPQWVFFRGYKKILTIIFLIGLCLMIIKQLP